MRIGAVFPQTEIGTEPGAIRAWAEAVEEFGYRHILAFDHVIGAGTDTRQGWTGYTSDDPFHEVFVLFGYLAGVTSTVELVTSVLILPQRQTALVAKQAAEVDVLSGGRMRLGVGVGWNHVEYEVLGEDFHNRGRRIEEQVELLRTLWTDTKADFDGKWHRVENAGVNPLPVRRGIPIWFGGRADVVFRRIGRIGDGWFPQRPPDEASRDAVERIRRYAEEAGRDPDEIGLEPRLNLNQVPESERLAFATGWRDLGATHLCVNTMGLGLASPADHITTLRDTLTTLEPLSNP